MTLFLTVKRGGRVIMIKLTKREKEIYNLLITTYMSYEQIAEKMCVSRATVSSHITRIFQKCNVSSMRELVIKHYTER